MVGFNKNAGIFICKFNVHLSVLVRLKTDTVGIMTKRLIIGLLILFTTSIVLQAQTEKGQIAISAEMGASLLALEWEIATELELFKAPPAFQGNIDYALLDVISIGGAFGYQKISTIERGHVYINTLGQYKTEDVIVSTTRMNFAYRVLFHYVRSENLDIYSGVRMGLSYYQYSNSSNDLNYSKGSGSFNEFAFAPQIIGLGLRMYVYKDLAVTTELAIGYPSFFSFGLTYRL